MTESSFQANGSISGGVTDIGLRRELFVDRHLVAETDGVELRLNQPRRGEIVMRTDRPWEGNTSGFITVFEDDGIFRMYYKAGNVVVDPKTGSRKRAPLRYAYAESHDGVNWTRPNLGIYEFDGSRQNNLVLHEVVANPGDKPKGAHGIGPFKDPNPNASPETRYKAIDAETYVGVYAIGSPDGIHWSLMQDEPIMTGMTFDSPNVAIWDPLRKEYRIFVRDFTKDANGKLCLRGIKTATSQDFINWSEAKWLEYPGSPDVQLYTNGVTVYDRAPHILLGFPARYVEEDSPCFPYMPEWEYRQLLMVQEARIGASRSDGLFMSSRDGQVFHRWDEAFLRPGPESADSWFYGDSYQSKGLLQTNCGDFGPEPELSFYATEGYWRGSETIFRRYSIRLDGFVSARAPLSGGTLITKPLRFAGDALEINFATSAAGSIRVAILDENGAPFPHYSLTDSDAIIGDTTARLVRWKDNPNVGQLAGCTVRLMFELKDADLFAYRFVKRGA